MNRVRAGATAVFLSLAAVGAAGATSFVARDAHASVSIAVLFDDLVRDASAAAVVTPMEQRSVWENGRIYTYTRVHVDSSVAGALPEEPWVRTMGGAVGKIGQLVEGEAVLTVGRPTLLFLQPQLDEAKQPIAGNFLVTARAQGQFPVKLDGAGKQRFMRAYGVGALVAPPAERVQRVAQMRRAAGVDDAAPLASDVLHDRPVEEATRAIVLAWTRLHGTPQK